MSKIDIVLIIILVIGAVAGYKKGFLSELFTLLGIILGVLAGFKLMGAAMLMLDEHYDINDKVLPYVAFTVVFLIVVVGVTLLGKAFKTSLEKTVLGSADKLFGAILGIFKAAFMASVLIWLFTSLNVFAPASFTEDAWLYPTVAQLAPAVTSWIGEIFPVFSDLFGQGS
ncbi:MAG: CvpA family protein [Cyclobacteriaceae bacterium]|nr:CvpA family protein [Cyclobacteriaceae bacterium]